MPLTATAKRALVTVPPRVGAIPNLDAIRDTNPELHRALASIQNTLDSISSYLNLLTVNAATATTVGAAGTATAPPATPTGYFILSIRGKAQQIPYYAVGP